MPSVRPLNPRDDSISQAFFTFPRPAVVVHGVLAFNRLDVCLPICVSTSMPIWGSLAFCRPGQIHPRNQPRTMATASNWSPGSHKAGAPAFESVRLAFAFIEKSNLAKISPIVLDPAVHSRTAHRPLTIYGQGFHSTRSPMEADAPCSRYVRRISVPTAM